MKTTRYVPAVYPRGIEMSKTSKMPEGSWSIDARRCNVGSKLRLVEGSVCRECYALAGRYNIPVVQNAQERRYQAIWADNWVPMMAQLIYSQTWFRWFDAGDLQGIEHLVKIVAICKLTPATNHWLPTKEYGVIRQYKRLHGDFPDNLVVRPSAPMVDGDPIDLGLPSSVVSRHRDYSEIAHLCPAKEQGGKCRDCRACWLASVKVTNYPAH